MIREELEPQAPQNENTALYNAGGTANSTEVPLRQRVERLAVAAVATLALVSSVWRAEKTPGDVPATASIVREAPEHYKPVTEFADTAKTNEEVARQSDFQFATYGHAIDIRTGGEDAVHAFNSYFSMDPFYLRRPKLREVIDIRDENTFRQELAARPKKYPFEIFNATDRPVDILYADYVLRATRYWLNQNSRHGGTIDIEGHTTAKIQPKAIPHSLVLVDNIPQVVTHGNKFNGATRTYPNLTLSLISRNGGTPASPFRHDTIATETCQSLVDVYDAKTLPGGKSRQAMMLRHVGKYWPQGAHDLNAAAQDVFCNGMGDIVASAWNGGWAGVGKREDMLKRFGFRSSRWDYNLYDKEVPEFIWLAKHVPQEYTDVITYKNNHSPTAQFYRQYHHFRLPS